MSGTALDTSVVVAALLTWHEAHRPAFAALTNLLDDGERLVLPAPVLTESYSVLTRLPAPHRLAPGDAIDLLSGSFEGSSTVVALTASQSWRLLHDCAHHGIAGGRAYDALILECARKGGAKRLLTLDRHDFLRLEPAGIEIVVPAAGS